MHIRVIELSDNSPVTSPDPDVIISRSSNGIGSTSAEPRLAYDFWSRLQILILDVDGIERLSIVADSRGMSMENVGAESDCGDCYGYW